MKRKNIIIIVVSVITVLAIAGGVLAAILLSSDEPKRLSEPVNLQINGTALTWDAVENASGYSVQIDNRAAEDNGKSTSFSLADLTPGTYLLKVMAKGDGKKYTDSPWSNPESHTVLDSNKTAVAKPVLSASSFTYDGGQKTVTLNPDNAAYSLDGDTVKTNAGNYTATVTLNDTDNYQWNDGTLTVLNLPWTINKATQSLEGTLAASNVTATSITLSVNPAPTGTLHYQQGTGAWQASATFSGLTADTAYTFNAKIVADDNHNESNTISASISTLDDTSVETTYTVTFNLQGGGASFTKKTNIITGKVEKPSDPLRSDFIFLGWYTESNGGTAFDFDTVLTADKTLYAKWEPEPTGAFTAYNVYFDTDSGTVISSVKSSVVDGKVSRPAIDPKKDGYEFDGWFTDDTFSTEFNFNTTVITEETTIYAKFTELPRYKITFRYGGGASDYIERETNRGGGTVAAPTESNLSLGANDLFFGWFTGQNGTGTAFDSATVFTASTIYYADIIDKADYANGRHSRANAETLALETESPEYLHIYTYGQSDTIYSYPFKINVTESGQYKLETSFTHGIPAYFSCSFDNGTTTISTIDGWATLGAGTYYIEIYSYDPCVFTVTAHKSSVSTVPDGGSAAKTTVIASGESKSYTPVEGYSRGHFKFTPATSGNYKITVTTATGGAVEIGIMDYAWDLSGTAPVFLCSPDLSEKDLAAWMAGALNIESRYITLYLTAGNEYAILAQAQSKAGVAQAVTVSIATATSPAQGESVNNPLSLALDTPLIIPYSNTNTCIFVKTPSLAAGEYALYATNGAELYRFTVTSNNMYFQPIIDYAGYKHNVTAGAVEYFAIYDRPGGTTLTLVKTDALPGSSSDNAIVVGKGVQTTVATADSSPSSSGGMWYKITLPASDETTPYGILIESDAPIYLFFYTLSGQSYITGISSSGTQLYSFYNGYLLGDGGTFYIKVTRDYGSSVSANFTFKWDEYENIVYAGADYDHPKTVTLSGSASVPTFSDSYYEGYAYFRFTVTEAAKYAFSASTEAPTYLTSISGISGNYFTVGGNGTSSSLSTPSYIFEAGEYLIRVTIKGGAGSITLNVARTGSIQSYIVKMMGGLDGLTEIDSQTITEGSSFTYSTAAPTIAGYKFTHWEDSDGNDYPYGIYNVAISKNLTFTAKYEQAYYASFTGVPNGDTITPLEIQYDSYTDEYYINLPTPPTVSGYQFEYYEYDGTKYYNWGYYAKVIFAANENVTITVKYISDDNPLLNAKNQELNDTDRPISDEGFYPDNDFSQVTLDGNSYWVGYFKVSLSPAATLTLNIYKREWDEGTLPTVKLAVLDGDANFVRWVTLSANSCTLESAEQWCLALCFATKPTMEVRLDLTGGYDTDAAYGFAKDGNYDNPIPLTVGSTHTEEVNGEQIGTHFSFAVSEAGIYDIFAEQSWGEDNIYVQIYTDDDTVIIESKGLSSINDSFDLGSGNYFLRIVSKKGGDFAFNIKISLQNGGSTEDVILDGNYSAPIQLAVGTSKDETIDGDTTTGTHFSFTVSTAGTYYILAEQLDGEDDVALQIYDESGTVLFDFSGRTILRESCTLSVGTYYIRYLSQKGGEFPVCITISTSLVTRARLPIYGIPGQPPRLIAVTKDGTSGDYYIDLPTITVDNLVFSYFYCQGHDYQAGTRVTLNMNDDLFIFANFNSVVDSAWFTSAFTLTDGSTQIFAAPSLEVTFHSSERYIAAFKLTVSEVGDYIFTITTATGLRFAGGNIIVCSSDGVAYSMSTESGLGEKNDGGTFSREARLNLQTLGIYYIIIAFDKEWSNEEQTFLPASAFTLSIERQQAETSPETEESRAAKALLETAGYSTYMLTTSDLANNFQSAADACIEITLLESSLTGYVVFCPSAAHSKEIFDVYSGMVPAAGGGLYVFGSVAIMLMTDSEAEALSILTTLGYDPANADYSRPQTF